MSHTKEPRKLGLVSRLGLVGFLFFFLKGLIWLVVIYLGWKSQS